MVDLKNPKLEHFKQIETKTQLNSTRKEFVSFFKVKPGSYSIPRTQHKITKLPDGIL